MAAEWLPCCHAATAPGHMPPPRQSLPPSSTPRDGQAMECAGLSCQHDRLCYCARLRPSWPQQLRWARTVMSCHGREHRTLSPSTVLAKRARSDVPDVVEPRPPLPPTSCSIRPPSLGALAGISDTSKRPAADSHGRPRLPCFAAPTRSHHIYWPRPAPSPPGRPARVDHIPATPLGRLS